MSTLEDTRIKFDCPYCENPIRARPEAAGKSGECKKCGMPVVVPMAAPREEAELIVRNPPPAPVTTRYEPEPAPPVYQYQQPAPVIVHNVVNQQSAPRWNPGVAAVLSLVIPGAGQIYKGQIFNGLLWMLLVIIGYIAFVVPGLVLHLLCIIGASMGNPNK